MQAKKNGLLMLLAMSSVWIPLRHVAAQDAPTFSIDYQGPPRGMPPTAVFLGGTVACIKEGDVLTAPPILPGPGPSGPPNPNVVIVDGPRVGATVHLGCPSAAVGPPCPAAGVPAGFTEVDALSYGVDLLILPTGSRTFPVNLSFSVDEFAFGLAGVANPPNVTTEGARLGAFGSDSESLPTECPADGQGQGLVGRRVQHRV